VHDADPDVDTWYTGQLWHTPFTSEYVPAPQLMHKPFDAAVAV
jgi:hypothetical protein